MSAPLLHAGPQTLCLGCGRFLDDGNGETALACPACAHEAAAALPEPRVARAELTAVYLADCAADALQRLAEDLDATDPERASCLGDPEDVARASLLTSRSAAREALLALRDSLPRGEASGLAEGMAGCLGERDGNVEGDLLTLRVTIGSAGLIRSWEARWRAYPDGMGEVAT